MNELTKKGKTRYINKQKTLRQVRQQICNTICLMEDRNQLRTEIVCFTFPPNMTAIFAITQGLNFLLHRLGLPLLVSQILAGVIFRKIVAWKNYSRYLFSREGVEILGTVAAIGYVFFMFQSGVKMDMGMLKRTGTKSLSIGMVSMLLPFPLCFAALTIIRLLCSQLDLHEMHNFLAHDFFTVAIYSVTSYPVIVWLLTDMKLLSSELGRLCLSTALITDVLSLVLVAGSSLGKIPNLHSSPAAGYDVIFIFAFVAVSAIIIRPLLKLLGMKLLDGAQLKEFYMYTIICLFFASIFLAEFYGLFVLYGPFLIGLMVPSGPPLGSALTEKFDAVSSCFLPFFISSCALRIDFDRIHLDAMKLLMCLSVVIIVSSAKFLSCFLLQAHFWKMPAKAAAAFSLVMCSKGIAELALYSFLNDNKVVKEDEYVFMLATVSAMGSIVPIMVRRLYDPSKRYAAYQDKTLANAADPEAELQVVSCIHLPRNVTATIKLLGAWCGGDGHVTVNVVHLIKLSGRSSPLFVSHRKDKVILCEYSYSDNVVRLFNEFEHGNRGSVSVEVATAVSPPNLMYDDVCTHALDRRASLIMLPFHITWWHHDGSVESEDRTIRELNRKILDGAPCSVGILVDRHVRPKKLIREEAPSPGSSSRCRAAMVFLGGRDDREALALSMRMAQDTRVSLSVVRLVSSRDSEGMTDSDHLDLMLDNAFLSNLKCRRYIRYREEAIGDAAETASIVRPFVNEYELIVVGRRNKMAALQTDGLTEWCEFPELGVIGDLLASKDFKGTCSILVIQQQQILNDGSSNDCS